MCFLCSWNICRFRYWYLECYDAIFVCRLAHHLFFFLDRYWQQNFLVYLKRPVPIVDRPEDLCLIPLSHYGQDIACNPEVNILLGKAWEIDSNYQIVAVLYHINHWHDKLVKFSRSAVQLLGQLSYHISSDAHGITSSIRYKNPLFVALKSNKSKNTPMRICTQVNVCRFL